MWNDILVAYTIINTRVAVALWRLSDKGVVFVAIKTFNHILVYDTNMDFKLICSVGITNSNLIFPKKKSK